MNEQLKHIPDRIRELRDILDLTVEEVAEKIDVTADVYKGYEDGSVDIPISALYQIASLMGVDFTVLLTGEAPRMQRSCVVRSGNGISVDRYPGYSFASLAYNYKGRVMEPMLVSLEASDKAPKLVSHPGQEFNFVTKGKVRVTVGSKSYELCAGDSIYFDPTVPHGQEAVDGDAEFLTIINEMA
ncbi:MAG: cupin domain-containing protein [Clostridia bacterium]|nr:cupin domain-containing protein [Clostridia bacterium]